MKKIGFVGAGKVGCTFGRYLYEKGNFKISGYYSNKYSDSEYAADKTDSRVFVSLEELVVESDVLFISTPDDSISKVWESVQNFNIQDKIICHLSGSLTSEIFFDISSQGAWAASLHPMLAISNKDTSIEKFFGAFFTLEGDDEALDFLKMVMNSTENKYKVIESDDKSKYHLAAVFMSNLVVSLTNASVNLLKDSGFSEDEALASLKALAYENLNNIFEKGVRDSLTGPVERGDVKTLKRHLSVLQDGRVELIYKLLSLEALEIAKTRKSNPNYDVIKDILCKY